MATKPPVPFTWLRRGLPDNFVAVPVKSSQIKILRGPHEFYQTVQVSNLGTRDILKILFQDLTSKSQSRITLSALYFGIKKQEQELVNILKRRIDENSKLKVTLLFDYTRGTRQEKIQNKLRSSVDLLKNLITTENVKISFYLSPLFSKSWFRRSILFPKQKQNEIIELQHMKCFIFDNDIIISGANLSESYFTNREDRYILIKNCPKLSNYFHDVIDATSSFSMRMKCDGSLDIDKKSFKYHPLKSSSMSAFIQDAQYRIKQVQNRHATENDLNLNDEADTLLIPLLQLPTYKINEERQFMNHLLSNVPSNSIMKVASGYFNLTSEYIDVLLKNRSKFKSIDVMVASEKVNSFYGARGLIGKIPSVYTTFSSSFFDKVSKLDDSDLIKIFMFERPSWTFHAKGLWLHLNPETSKAPMLVTIGSSNFGYRSSYKDLENQVVILTKNEQLISQFTEEYKYFWSFGHRVTKLSDFPHVPYWIRIVSKFIKDYF